MSRGPGVDRRELGESTSHGQLYVDRLRSAHLTLSGVALVAFGGLVGALPLVALAWPSIESRSVAGIPLGVLLLLAPYPAYVVIGAIYARRADGLDETFAALVEDGEGGRRPRDDGPGPTGATATTPPAAPATPSAAPGTPSSAPTPPRPPAP
jgi:hypothetical protein